MAAPPATEPPPAFLETIQLEHVPATHSVNVAVFRDVENAQFLQEQLLRRNAEYEYAFIDATSILSRLQVLSAVYKAITIQLGGGMKTPNIHSETVCSLSPNNNISEAYRRYGITPASKHIIVVKVLISSASTSPRDVEAHLRSSVRGRPCPFADEALAGFTDWARVRKYYKLNGIGWLDGVEDEGRRRAEMEVMVLGSMALRGL